MEHVQIPLDVLISLTAPPDGLLIPGDKNCEIVCRIYHGAGM